MRFWVWRLNLFPSLPLFIAGRSEYEERFDNAIPCATYVGYLCFANNARPGTHHRENRRRTCTHVRTYVRTYRLSIPPGELREIMMVRRDIRVTLISALRQTDDARCVKCYWFTLQAEWVSIFDFRVGTVVTFSVGFDPTSSSSLHLYGRAGFVAIYRLRTMLTARLIFYCPP